MQMEDEARRAGAEHYVRKPIDETRFLAELKKFLPIHERADPRVTIDVPISFWRDGEPSTGRLLNLSRSGLFVGTEQHQPVGARLEISFSLPHDFSGKRISAEAMVVRVNAGPPKGFGARFFQISSGARLFIEEFLERLTQRQGTPTR
jgi:hypothetical protein